MSLQPPKHSECSWPKGRRSRQRNQFLDYNLIVTEGTKTEPYYFKALKARISAKESNRIQLDIKGGAGNTTGLLEYAKKLVKRSANGYSHVWLVYDKDDFSDDRFNEMEVVCKKLNEESETEYHAIWSNQCIELWFLLHFMYLDSDLHRSEYYPKLTKELDGNGKYEKNRDDIFEILLPHLDTAISHARRLDKKNLALTPSEASPGTKMHIMMEKFKSFL